MYAVGNFVENDLQENTSKVWSHTVHKSKSLMEESMFNFEFKLIYIYCSFEFNQWNVLHVTGAYLMLPSY